MNEEEDGRLPSRYKKYLKVNLISLFFIGVSFISITLAWFAYSGIANTSLDVNVKAWYIEFEKDGAKVSNDIVISLPDILPGMETVNEVVNIMNEGDSDASLHYEVTYARIFDEELVPDGVALTTSELEDRISHDYPFHVNIDLSRHYARPHADGSVFDVSVSWPLDSGSDEFDSLWGNRAYEFQQGEEDKKALDANYQTRPAIKIVITITAEQYTEALSSSDFNYNLGDLVIYDVKNNRGCSEIGPSCIVTHIISTNSTLGESTVLLLPDVYSTYLTSSYDLYENTLDTLTADWNVEFRNLEVGDLVNVISTDVQSSIMERSMLSDTIVGKYSTSERLESELAKLVSANGMYKYDNSRFSYLTSNKCYWTSTNYNEDKAFAFTKNSDAQGKIYGEIKTTQCSVIPVIIAPKSNI